MHSRSLDVDRHALMQARLDRRAGRRQRRERIAFLDPDHADCAHVHSRAGRARRQVRRSARFRATFSGSGSRAPARPPSPNGTVEQSIRNVAYALLSGADGWMFDGEDALGQISTMSLDNQRNLKLAHPSTTPVFLNVAEQVAGEMNRWAEGFLGGAIIDDWQPAAAVHHQDLPAARPAS